MSSKTNQLPDGWDAAKVAAIAKYYDEQSEDDVLKEIDDALEDPDSVMVQIPRDLLPAVLQLMSEKKKTG